MGSHSIQKGKVCASCGKELTSRQRKFCSINCRNTVNNLEQRHLSENQTLVDEGRKRCSICNRIKRVGLFYKDKARHDGLTPACKVCWKRRYSQSRQSKHAGDIERKYGINMIEYELLLSQQGGKCAICGGGTTKEFFGVDHNHQTGEIRGLLCSPCNHTLGRVRDSADQLRLAAAYLESPPARKVLTTRNWTPYRGNRG